ncbi:MAG: flagellar biosynthetic protein FliO [Proteobacteria bacterium]|nr:flagellar biosynthetic protein FliO [Pseudomonadota bacterium]MBU4328492.1 flagellar biosynthetic protein FliO [Pseudomonadota bacterium]MDO8948708.1 flagellar biosynthetic protein FliO [Desulfocapsaceae bacterium]
MRLILALIVFGLSATCAFAGTESPFSFSATLRLFWGLLIVFGVLLIVYALAKKKLSFLNAGSGKGAITIIEMRHLMPKKSLCLIKVRDQEYLLGLGNDQINLIAAIEPVDKKNFATTLATAASDKGILEDDSTH